MKIARSTGEQRKLNRYGRCETARINYVASEVYPGMVDQALTEVFAIAPEKWNNIPKDSAEILRTPGGGIVEIAVNYRSADLDSGNDRQKRKQPGDREWKVRIISKNSWKSNSLGCILCRKVDPDAPEVDPGTLIDWNGLRGSAMVSGKIPVYSPEMTLECIATFRKNKAESRNYLRQVAELVGKVNAENFHNWHAGELLFTGLVKSEIFKDKENRDLCNLTFRFLIRTGGERRAAGIELGYVDGWDHLWQLRTPGGKNQIHSVYVSRIYERASFAVLEL